MALTARSAIKRGMQLIGRLGRGMSVNADDEADWLVALNAMLKTWHGQGLRMSANVRTTITWTGGNHSRTLGPTGQITLANIPLSELDHAARVENNQEYAIDVLDAEQWREETDRTSEGVIERIRLEPTVPNATLYGFPVPSADTVLALYYRDPAVRAFVNLTTSYELPDDGYEEAIVYNLALRRAPFHGRALDSDSRVIAQNAIATLMARNEAENIPHMTLDDTIMQMGLPEVIDINTGEPM